MSQNMQVLSQEEEAFNPSGMIAATRKLSTVLSQEIALLKDMKIARIHELYEDKMELSAILEGYKSALQKNPALLESIPQKMLDEMRKEAASFERLIEEDHKQITRAKEVHKLVMDAIKKTLEKNVVKSSGYNKKGIIDPGNSNAYVSRPISINERI